MSDQEPFLKGLAMSVWQASFDTTSQWREFVDSKNFFSRRKFKAAYAGGSRFWDMYERDLQLSADLGATSFRFTIEWARLQPNGPGDLDMAAVDRYHRIMNAMQSRGIEPMATLHQFVHPAWFERLGGWEKEENIRHFEQFCCDVFKIFGQRIRLWAILNEPTVHAFMGYIGGVWPPGKKGRMYKAGLVMANMLKAHCRVYRLLKKLPGGSEAMLGFCHQHMSFIARHNMWHVKKLCKWMTVWLGTYSVLNFFQTGIFKWDMPFHKEPAVLYVDEGIQRGEKVIDFWGINYYSRPAVQWNVMIGPGAPHEPVSDERFRLSPQIALNCFEEGMRTMQGLYDSIVDASKLKVPIYVTEHGCADQKDRHRAWYIKASYAMILKAIADGYDVRGSYWWTLMDNCEWHTAYNIKFGLYAWEPNFAKMYKDSGNRPPEGCKLRDGGQALQQVYHTWPNTLNELRSFAMQHAANCVALQPVATETADRWTRENVTRIAVLPAVHGADLAYQSLEATYRLTAGTGTAPLAPAGAEHNRQWCCCFQISHGPSSHNMQPLTNNMQDRADGAGHGHKKANGHDEGNERQLRLANWPAGASGVNGPPFTTADNSMTPYPAAMSSMGVQRQGVAQPVVR